MFSSYILVFVVLFFWSSAFVAIRYLAHEVDPLLVAALRLVIAGIIMLAFIIVRYSKFKVTLVDLLSISVLGVLGLTIYNIGLMIGESTQNASTASFIIAQTPVFSALFAALFLGERISIQATIGMFICLIGMLVIYFSVNGFSLSIEVGIFWILLATVSQSLYFVLQKYYIKKYSPLHTTAYAMLGAAIPAALFLPYNSETLFIISVPHLLIIVYLAVFPSILAYFLWAKAIQKIPVVWVTNTLFLLPLLTIVQGFVFLCEYPSSGELIGGLVTLMGVIFVQNRLHMEKPT